MVLNLGIPSHQYPLKWVDAESGPCIVVGGGRCVWNDIQRAQRFARSVITINDITMHLPMKIDHVYSNDHLWLPKWKAARRDMLEKQFGETGPTHSNTVGGDITWPWPGHGSSGLGATYTALALGYSPVVLCGIPLDDSGHYFDPPWVESNFLREVPLKGNSTMKYWHDARERVFQGKVFSMSGRTRDLLGEP